MCLQMILVEQSAPFKSYLCQIKHLIQNTVYLAHNALNVCFTRVISYAARRHACSKEVINGILS